MGTIGDEFSHITSRQKRLPPWI